MDNEAVLQDLNQTVVRYVQNDIKRAEAYQGSVIERTVKERYAIYYADKEYYRNKFPILSKTSDLVSTDVADTIEWALPSLMKVFTGSDEVITIAGVTEEDDTKAETMQELLVYQLQRQNKFFPILYNWMKDALITGMGIVKCYWERTEGFTTEQAVLNNESLQALIETGVNVTDIQGPDAFGDFTVTYQSPYYVKNAPKIENILISEFIYSPDAKSLEEANFVAHKRKVTMSYLREREAQGVYANIDAIKPDSGYSVVTDPVQDVIGDNYNDIIGDEQKARQEVTIYECYTKIDVNNDGILEDMIITICGDTIIRMEQNYMGRHPFFAISPTKDPHRIWVKRSYAELIGELQDLKVALTRQIMQNVALTNDPKMLLDETAINIDDFVQGRKVIRMKAGHSLHEVAMPMNISPLSPQTFTFLEWIEGQKENRTGITRYNQGLDANSLNKTATGISAILGQSSQRLELVARMFAETGLYELFRFMVSLNQKFIDQQTVIRLTNKEMKITPEDLDGSFDLIVNAGISISTKESTIMATQTLLTAIMQANAAGYMISTPENVYNLFKKWIESIGFKNYGDYITDPAISQQRMLIEIQLKQQVLSQLPPDAMQYYAQFGILPPQYLNMLPPQLQVLFRGAGNEPGTQEQTNVAGNFGGTGFGGTNLSGGLATGLSRVDNQQPQNVQRGPSQGPTEPSRGIGGF
ncbi:MAG: poly(3-hydroxybutyrate) depolymerase [Veillonella sp.]|nr:poly(3-hydroxybutyrate) depolymerase [Veillonella sp.]